MMKMIRLSTIIITFGLFSFSACASELEKKMKECSDEVVFEDCKYASLIEIGSAYENESKLELALNSYLQAEKVDVPEIGTYYVLLDIGRILYKLGKYEKAKDVLTEYLERTEIDVKVERAEMLPPGDYRAWGFSPELFEALLTDREEAQVLLDAIVLRRKLRPHN